MKVSIGIQLRAGPWGGGNQAMSALAAFLRDRGAEVVFDLSDPDLDIILMVDPRSRSASAAYADREIFRYLSRVNANAVVIHRVNECDERKGTTGVNRRLRRANLCADHSVFVSAWLRDLHIAQGMPCESISVIRNGSDQSLFNPEGHRRWDGSSPLKLVTHHWSGNWMKGFDIYQRIDEFLDDARFRDRIAFTYIGNLPDDFAFTRAQHVPPTQGADLAAKLRENHVYVTASLNEPGSNHQNEGALCGLPLLYIRSGCMPEYCEGFGVGFTPDDFEEKLEEMLSAYDHWAAKMPGYPHTARRMCEEYYRLFCDLIDRRADVAARRSRWRTWRWRFSAG